MPRPVLKWIVRLRMWYADIFEKADKELKKEELKNLKNVR